MHKEIIIFGCGGVGSWLANFLVRNNACEVLSLVDFDTLEEKNLQRQSYYKGMVGLPKTRGLRDDLQQIMTDSNDVIVQCYSRKIIEDIDLQTFNRDAFAIITTDNIQSKRMIARHFKRFLIANCDKNFLEVKSFLDETDTKAWDMGGGYSNEQDIFSNVIAAGFLYKLIVADIATKGSVSYKIESLLFNDFYGMAKR